MKKQKEPFVHKEQENKIEKTKEVKQPTLVDVEKLDISTSNYHIELSKLKVSIPFNELLRNREHRDNQRNGSIRHIHLQTSFQFRSPRP